MLNAVPRELTASGGADDMGSGRSSAVEHEVSLALSPIQRLQHALRQGLETFGRMW